MTFTHPPYMPGINARPDEAVFESYKAGLGPGMTPESLAASAAFRGGLTAYESGYFWEAHELWEAVWHCLPNPSPERHALRGLIQLANASLKSRMGRDKAARRILSLAREAIGEAYGEGAESLMGFTRRDMERMADDIMQNNA